MSGGRRARRAILHFVSSVLMCSGVLLIADAVITVAWQEPVSAVVAERLQAELEDDLDDARALAVEDRRLLADTKDHERLLAELAKRARNRTKRGDAIGRIVLPTIDRDYVLAEGTDTETLRKGPSHYGDTPFPGQRGTIGVAGHRTTYGAPFRPIDKLDPGDEVVLEMSYGRFVYEVEATRIVKPTALWVKRRAPYDRLILSACHPKYSAAKRIVVFARQVDAKPL